MAGFGASHKGKRRAFAAGPSKNDAAIKTGAKKPVENPFDKFANARKKHEVLNRKVKGEDRNVGRARAKAIDERKSKLLSDYNRSKKTNVIMDKRFGENDPTMSLEERMFMRFQKEKTKSIRSSTNFNLDAQDSELLTHKGQVLGQSNLDDNDWVSSDDDEADGANKYGGLDKKVVDSLHFGGGFLSKQGGDSQSLDQVEMPRKSRLDALQEIVMKSKLRKLEKKEAKDEQEDERTKLDKAYEELFTGSLLEFSNKGSNRRDNDGDHDALKRSQQPGSSAAKNSIESAAADLDDYDVALKEMAYEARLPASERTKSAEEVALEEQKRIEELEAARIRRMQGGAGGGGRFAEGEQGGNDDVEEDNDEDDGGNLTRSKKRKFRTDDEIDDDAFDTAVKNTKKLNSFQNKAKGVDDVGDVNADYNEYVGLYDEEYEDSSSDDEDDDDDDDDEEEEEEEEEEDDDHDEEDGENDDNEEEEEAANDGADVQQRRKNSGDDGSGKNLKSKADLADDGVNIEMPHKLECPQDLEAFDALVEEYVVDPKVDMMALIERILAWNNVNLPGTAGAENRGLMHNFLDILIKHFVRVGDTIASEDVTKQTDGLAQLDYLSGAIFKVSHDVKEAASAALWGRTVKIIHAQLQKRLRDYAQGHRSSSCWPSLGRIFLLQLLGRVFSVTDRQNDVVGPASLLLCEFLALCPVCTPADACSGLMVSSILLGTYYQETKRYVPEVTAFINGLLSLYLPPIAVAPSSAQGATQSPPITSRKMSDYQNTFNTNSLHWLRGALSSSPPEHSGKSKSKTAAPHKTPFSISWSYFVHKKHSKPPPTIPVPAAASGGYYEEEVAAAAARATMSTAIVTTGYELVRAVATQYQQSSHTALPEILHPLLVTLRALRPQDRPIFPVSLQHLHVQTIELLMTASESCKTQRQPLQWRKPVTVSIETKAPRFALDYTFKKDNDPDQDKAKMKQLTRQLKREKKAAIRELRRDSAFVDQERYNEERHAKESRQAERHRNFGWMEEQQATINQQVKKGGGLMKGGGSGVLKNARVKRL